MTVRAGSLVVTIAELLMVDCGLRSWTWQKRNAGGASLVRGVSPAPTRQGNMDPRLAYFVLADADAICVQLSSKHCICICIVSNCQFVIHSFMYSFILIFCAAYIHVFSSYTTASPLIGTQ